MKIESVIFNVKIIELNTSNVMDSKRINTSAITKMIENPISFVKNTRQTYSRQFESIITEVQVQFFDENPCWIPLETLIAMEKVCNE